jgi:hypothetical protein
MSVSVFFSESFYKSVLSYVNCLNKSAVSHPSTTVTLNVNGLHSPIERHLRQTGLKRKICQSFVYKRPNLLTETNTCLGWKAGRGFTKLTAPENRRIGNTYFREDFKLTLVKWDKGSHFIRGNTSKGYNNYQSICTQCQCTQLHQAYTKGLKSTYRLQHSLVADFNTPLSPISRSSRQKINKEILELNGTID